MRTCDESLKVYPDNYSVRQTARHEGRQQGRQERKERETAHLSLPGK